MTNPFTGEPHGLHTPLAGVRLVDYLQRATGDRWQLMGSVGRGMDSTNDIDVSWVDPTHGMTDDQERDYYNALMAVDYEQQQRDPDGWMAAACSEPVDDVGDALQVIGFSHVRDMQWLGIWVARYEDVDGHAVEVWRPSGDDNYRM